MKVSKETVVLRQPRSQGLSSSLPLLQGREEKTSWERGWYRVIGEVKR